VIPGFEYRWQVEAQLAGFENERRGAQTDAHRKAIEQQEAIFKGRARAHGSGGRLPGAQKAEIHGNVRVGRQRRARAHHRMTNQGRL
jgi:hypothetical protein